MCATVEYQLYNNNIIMILHACSYKLMQINMHIQSCMYLSDVQWTLRMTDALVHRSLPFIWGMSFNGVFG